MARDDKARMHFRVALRQYAEGWNLNHRRSARGAAYVDINEQYGEVLISVENMKYLGTAPNGLPYYYEGWMILSNGYKISTGPISIDGKGCGKSYWRFDPDNIGGVGAKSSDIRGFAMTEEVMDTSPYPGNGYVLVGCLNEEDEFFQPPTVPASSEVCPPYSWYPMGIPGMWDESTFLFGFRASEAGLERIAFAFPGVVEQPAIHNEPGEWRPSGTGSPSGYWIYYRKPHSAA